MSKNDAERTENDAKQPAKAAQDVSGPAGIGPRLAQLRRSFAGERGQSRFAGKLGLTASTYANYEKGRTPPPQLLLKVSQLTGADLMWLLTGEEARPGSAATGWAANPQHAAILERAARLLADRPANLAALAAFLDLLEDKTLLERSMKLAGAQPASVERSRGAISFGRWAPIFGRAAAGLARFWEELGGSGTDQPASALDQMITQAASLSQSSTKLAVLETIAGPDAPAGAAGAQKGPARPREYRVRLVQLAEPITEFQLSEFLEAGELAERYQPLFGLRLDGDSMAPTFPDGAIVICCPGEPARAGQPAVVRLAGQIGLSCKIYRPRGAMVRLVAANDRYPVQEFPAKQLEWALAVLGSVRLG